MAGRAVHLVAPVAGRRGCRATLRERGGVCRRVTPRWHGGFLGRLAGSAGGTLPGHTVRISVNRAFRAPSFINNHLDKTGLLNEVNLSAISPALAQFVVPVRAVGNAALDQETMTERSVTRHPGGISTAMPTDCRPAFRFRIRSRL
jgi:hypothetical protein